MKPDKEMLDMLSKLPAMMDKMAAGAEPEQEEARAEQPDEKDIRKKAAKKLIVLMLSGDPMSEDPISEGVA